MKFAQNETTPVIILWILLEPVPKPMQNRILNADNVNLRDFGIACRYILLFPQDISFK